MKASCLARRVFIGLGLLVAVYTSLTATSIWRFGLVDETRSADAALVLGAGIFNGEPSPVFKERINHGIWLYNECFVDTIILSGGTREGDFFSDAYRAKQYAIEQGVPPAVILIEEESSITEENLYYAAELLRENNLSTVLVVSDPLHMKRAMLMADDQGLHAFSSPTPTTRYETLRTQLPFLARETFFLTGYRLVRLFR